MKKAISVLLIIAILCPLLTGNVYADENESTGYIQINSEYYYAICKEDTIYMSAENIAAITGYDYTNDGIMLFQHNGIDDVTTVVFKDNETVRAMGNYYEMERIIVENTVYLPLEKMLYLLHAQWCVEDGKLVVQPLPYTIIEFMSLNTAGITSVETTQNDLLMNGESDMLYVFRSSLSKAYHDFSDLFILYWPGKGISPTVTDEYIDAMLQLAIDDGDFLNASGQENIEEIAGSSSFKIATDNLDNMSSIMSLPDNASDIYDFIYDLSKEHKSIKFGQYHNISSPQISAKAKELGAINDAITLAGILFNFSEIAVRSESWGADFIREITLLRDYDSKKYDAFTSYYIQLAAENVINEYSDPIEAASNTSFEKATSFFMDKFFDATIFGKFFAVMNAGIAIARLTNENVRTSMDVADFSYMVNCNVNIEYVAMSEMLYHAYMLMNYDEFMDKVKDEDFRKLFAIMNDHLTEPAYITQSLINQVRDCTMLALRTNLRNWAFIYYINAKSNNTPDWETSSDAILLRNRIYQDYALICQLMSTEQFDQLLPLDEFENMYSDEYGCVREQIGVESITWYDKIPVYDIPIPSSDANGIDHNDIVIIQHSDDDMRWKQAYIDYLSYETDGNFEDITLIYINDDDIPELLITYYGEASGTDICTYYEQKVVSQHLRRNYGVSYIERGNLMCNSNGHMDNYYDEIYKIENGHFVLVSYGNYGAENNANIQYYDNYEEYRHSYRYYWNDFEVSEDEYNQEFQAIFDVSLASNPYDNNHFHIEYDLDEILKF